jgi:hypothetical protein
VSTLRSAALPILLGACAFAAACVDDEFDEGQFLCAPGAGEQECPPGLSCAADGRCRKPASLPGDACVPKSCVSVAPACGALDNGCGGAMQCFCAPPDTCGGGGVLGRCGCAREQTADRAPGAFWNDATIGSIGWTEPSRARASDDAHAAAPDIGLGEITNYLKAADFGFQLPSSSVIRGIQVLIERSSSGPATLVDHQVRVALDGKLLPHVAERPESWPAQDAVVGYGGETELWEAEAVTPELVNRPNFGMALAVTGQGEQATAQVDQIRIRLFFTNPACPGSR